jgi:hypothetical protein
MEIDMDQDVLLIFLKLINSKIKESLFIDGQYIYINSFTKTMPSANAILTSPKLKVFSSTVGCLK